MLMPLPEAIIAVWAPFAALFTQPVWCHVRVLWMGAMLCREPRTVVSVLRVMGLGGERRFEKYSPANSDPDIENSYIAFSY
jgi:hypothetical protein